MEIDHSNLIGNFDDDELKSFLQSHFESIESLAPILAEARASEIGVAAQVAAAEAADPSTGLLFQPKIDPSLPEIVLLHGVTDCHLANVFGGRRRIWLIYIELVLGRFSKCLTLQSDGASDQHTVRIETDGLVWRKYKTAFDTWRQHGFQPHDFCYDWRRSVTVAADALDAFLKGLSTVKSGRKVILVCHGMGGLVASVYAARNAHWSSSVQHCILVGSPLGGTYSVAAAIMGKSESFQELDRFSIFETLEDFQLMGASFPGLIDLLPNPDVFPEAAELYSVRGWPGAIKLDQQWLDHSREVKKIVWSSPLFSNATHLVSQDLPTLAAMPWNSDHTDRTVNLMSPEGDGSVLSRSSLVPGLKAYKVRGEHSLLCTQSEVIQAVEAIARGQQPSLPTITTADLTNAMSVDSTLPAGLVTTSALKSNENKSASNRFSEALLKRLASDGTSGAMLGLTADTMTHGFDIDGLKSDLFSWQTALSLAMASEAAYQKNARELIDRVTTDWKFTDCFLFDVADTQGFIAWDAEIAMLSFRGTEQNLGDWLRNLSVASFESPIYGRVHSGFYRAFQDAKNRIDGILNLAMNSTKELWITGHSLGGALAVIAASEYVSQYRIRGIYTYGQPKLGTEQLSDFYSAAFPGRYFRFVNHNDVVPQVPPGYGHFGDLHWFDANGNVKPNSTTALSAGLRIEQPPELSKTQFDDMQRRLNAMNAPITPGGLRVPLSESELDSAALFGFGISIKDHSIREAYVPIIARQF